MEDSSSSSSCPDVEQCLSESESNQSLSVGYFPSEDTIHPEDVIPSEDVICEDPSGLSLPPDQGAWETESVSRPLETGNEIEDKPENLDEEDIDEIVKAYLSSLHEDSLVSRAQSDDDQRMDNCQQETITETVWELDDFVKTIMVCIDNMKDEEDDDLVLCDSPQEEDLQPSSSDDFHINEVSPEDSEAGQELPMCKSAENGDNKQCPEMSPGFEDDEIVEMESQETCTAGSTPVSSEQLKEGEVSSDKESTSCLNFRGLFHWVRKRVVPSLPRRKRRDKANKVPSCWH